MNCLHPYLISILPLLAAEVLVRVDIVAPQPTGPALRVQGPVPPVAAWCRCGGGLLRTWVCKGGRVPAGPVGGTHSPRFGLGAGQRRWWWRWGRRGGGGGCRFGLGGRKSRICLFIHRLIKPPTKHICILNYQYQSNH